MSEQKRLRGTTYTIDPEKYINEDQVGGLVIKLKPEMVEELIKELEQTVDTGATMFFSTFENESQYGDGATYLSTTVGIQATDEGPNDKASRKSSGGRKKADSQQRKKMAKDVDRLVGPKR